MSIVLEDNSLIEKRNDRLEQAFREKIFPYFIEHEYRRFYSLAGKDQYAGAWYELKDLSEVVIKLPILLGLSYLFFRYSEKKEEDIRGITEAILSRMITKTLSLGDWSNILETLSKNKFIEQKIPALSEVIKNAKDFCNNCNIVEWRNNMIGHGALPFEDSEEFKDYICNITQGIDTCLENSQEYYANIEIIGNDVLEVVISGERFQVDKCIFRQIFFFDSFNKQTYNIDIIDYLNGKRDKEKNRWYYEFMRKHALEEEIQRYRGADSQKRMWEWQDIMGLQILNKADKYQNNKLVMQWLTKCMERWEKGIFLLSMDRGMGKTAFVSSINQLISNVKDGQWITRVYYCSALKYRSMSEFAEEFNSLFAMKRDARRTIVNNKLATLRWEDDRKRLCECLKDIQEYAAKQCFDPQIKVLFVIDGIDEIYEKMNEKNIFDFIPKREELLPGTYILLTSRNGDTEKLDDYTYSMIRVLREESIDEEYDFTLANSKQKKEYTEMLRAYLQEALKQAFDIRAERVQEVVKEQFSRLCEESRYRFVDFRLNTELLKEAIRHDHDPNSIFVGSDGVQDYFIYMENVLGEKLFHKAGRILLILAIAKAPLTVDDCVFLEELKEDVGNTDILAVLKIFESFIVYQRGYNTEISNNTVIKIANERYRAAIMKKFQVLLVELIEQWIRFIEDFYQNRYIKDGKYDINRDYSFPVIYLHAEIYEYVRYVKEHENVETYWNRIHTVSFADAIYQYEKFMPAQALSICMGDTDIVKDFDINMSYSVIRISEEMEKPDRGLLAAAYNSFLLHKKDIFKKEWGIGSVERKALEEKKRLLGYCDEGISIASSKASDLKMLELKSKLCAIKGIFIREQLGDSDEVEELFEESYKITEYILTKDIVQGSVLYLQAVERMLDVFDDKQDASGIKRLYSKTVKDLVWLKNQKIIKPYLIVNTRGRIEYGILPREAMFYGKIADTCYKYDWHPDGMTVEDLYKKSLNILGYVEQQRDAEDKQLYTIKEYKKKALDKYGRYEYKKKNMKLARELFGQSADIAEELVRNAKISADIQTIQISLCYVMLTDAADDCEKGKIQNRLQCIEKWLKQSKVYDRTVESQFEDMKRKWM